MSDYHLRFHLLRLPQLDRFDPAGQRIELGFAIGVDADLDPMAFSTSQDGYGDRLLRRVREGVAEWLPHMGAEEYETAMAEELGLLMPWTWCDVALTLSQGNLIDAGQEDRQISVTLLVEPDVSAQDRLPLYRHIDRRKVVGDDWRCTIFAKDKGAANWTRSDEVDMRPDGFACWPALLATLGQETAPVGVRYFHIYRLFRVASAELNANGQLYLNELSFKALDVSCRFAFAGQTKPEIQITLGGEQTSVDAECAALDPTLDVGWEQTGGWLSPTAVGQGPGLDVLPNRMLPWFDRAAWLLAQDDADPAEVVVALDNRLGIGARFVQGEPQHALDGGNLIRLVAEGKGAVTLEQAASGWTAAGSEARLKALITDAGDELAASWNALAALNQPLAALTKLVRTECVDRLRELHSALLRPASLQRRFLRLWAELTPASHEGWPRLSQIDIARRIELDAGSAGVQSVIAAPGALASREKFGQALTVALGRELTLIPAQATEWGARALAQIWPGEDGAPLPADGSDAEGLAMQIQSNQDDRALADLAGVGLLLRRLKPAPSGWRCPLLGRGISSSGPDDVSVENDGKPVPGEKKPGWLGKAVLAVLPFQRMHGLLRTDAVYRGETLVQFADALGAKIEDDGTLGAALDGMYRVHLPNDAASDLMRTPSLAYGADYEFAAFGVPNPGVLPRELQSTDADDPLTFRAELPNELPGVPTSGPLAFRRTRPLQALEFVEIPEPGAEPKVLVPARAGVPYGRESTLRAFEVERPAWVGATCSATTLAPLLLLPGIASTASLRVLPPRIDCQTFLRWCEYDRLDARNPAEHAKWERFLLAAEALSWYLEDMRDDATRAASLPLDPAVSALEFALFNESGQLIDTPVSVGLLDVLPAKVPEGYTYRDFLKHDRGGAVLQIHHAPDAAIALIVSADGVNLTLPDETIHYLWIYPHTVDIDRTKRFARPAGSEQWPGVLLPVEVGTRRRPLTNSQLYEALHLESPARLPGDDARDIELSLRVSDAQRKDFRLLHQIDVGVQLWRWQGRPFPSPARGARRPLVDSTNGADLRWEADTFSDRSDQPSQHASTRVLDGKSVLLRREAAGNDRRERWFRLNVSARHRYADLYRALGKPLSEEGEVERFVAARNRQIPNDGAMFDVPEEDRWIRAWRPAGNPDVVHAPVIKALLPLTLAAYGSGSQASGVLCLLNESFCEVGGLAEGLEAVIEQVALHTENHDLVLEEYGHEPLFSGKERNSENALRPIHVTGPLGHTFDTDTHAPLFVASSFILDPPVATRSFDFLKIKLRRVLDPAGFDDQIAMPAALGAAQMAASGEYLAEIAAESIGQHCVLELGAGAGRCSLTRVAGKWHFDLAAPWASVVQTGNVDAKGALRLCLKRLRDIRLDGTLNGSEWELAISARVAAADSWQRVAVALYSHVDADAPLGFTLQLIDCDEALVASGPRLSDYTPGIWVQCLPDREWLLPSGFDGCELRHGDDGLHFALLAESEPLVLQSLAQSNPGEQALPPRGIAQLLLITRATRGIDGREFESYVGIYACDGTQERWHALEGDRSPPKGAALQGRVVWVQVAPTRFDQTFSYGTFWSLCFPDVTAVPEAIDAQARIVSLSRKFTIGTRTTAA